MEFIAIDLETTGTLAYVDRIVEMAAVKFDCQGKVEDEFHTLINPEVEISEEVSKINGITNEMVASQPRIEEVLEPFSLFCNSFVTVAHNATFDFQFLRSAFERYSITTPTGPMLDTYSLAKKTLPGLGNYKLGTLIKHLKISSSTLHRAKEDARCCGRLFYYLIQKIETNNWKKAVQFSGKAALRFPKIGHTYKQFDLL